MDFPSVGFTDMTVCLHHVEDEHLRARLIPVATKHQCSFCPRQDDPRLAPTAVNLEYLARVVYDVASRFYEDASNARIVEGEMIDEEFDTLAVVYDLLDRAVPAALLDAVVRAVADLISEPSYWIASDDLSYVENAWEQFADTVKHRSRLVLPPRQGNEFAPSPPERLYRFLDALLQIVDERTGLVREIPVGSSVFRGRVDRDSFALQRDILQSPAQRLGPPPKEKAAAGRMNAQGVSVFYCAFDAETACAEVVIHSPYDGAVVGEFKLQRSIRIFDLTAVPVRPSILDESADSSFPYIAFFDLFRDAISQPVILDGMHPVDYAPTQLVTEFLRWGTAARLDGIAWESRVRPEGTNLVLFYGEDAPFGSTKDYSADSPSTALRLSEEEQPVFLVDPSSIRRYVAERTVAVKPSIW